MSLAVECRGLTKSYDGFVAVDHIDLSVDQGRIFGFLGPNGAGKTTTIRMLGCLIRPTAGSAKVWGMDVGTDYISVKRTVGYLPESPGYYPEMTPLEFLGYFSRLFRVKGAEPIIDGALRTVGLHEERNLQVGAFSLGMRQRLNIARILLHDPRLLILDEPTSGLDPRGTREVRELIRSLGEGGKTIFLCTHILPEAEMVCDDLAILNKGKIAALDSPDDLRHKVRATNIIRVGVGSGGVPVEDITTAIEGLPWVKSVTVGEGGTLAVEAGTFEEKRPDLARFLVKLGAELLSLDLEEPTLEDVFMTFTE
jgi:ABC-2 type transport system ATP-binding protein